MQLATLFSSSEAVLGYELINEPWCGNAFADPELLVPTVADKRNLQPLYDMVSAAVRPFDANHPLLFAGVTWDDTGVGFEHVPGGDAWRNKSVLAYHFYIPPQIDLTKTMQACPPPAVCIAFPVPPLRVDLRTHFVCSSCTSLF
jgi:endoglycosylceramidase